MNPFKRDEPCFLVDPFEHAGRYRGVHGGTMMCWEVKDTMFEPFSDITTAVCTELENYRFPRSMVVMFDLFLRGTSSSSVEVFVMLAGATEQHRKKAVKRLRKSSLAKKYPGLKMDHWNWPPDAPQVVMMASDDDTLPWTVVHRSQGYDIRFSGKSPKGSSLEKLGNTSYHIVATDRGSAGFRREATAISTSVPKDTPKQKMGVLSHFVVVGGDRYLLVPAHIFLSNEPEEDNEFSDTDDPDSDSNSESSSDIESSFDVMLRAGSATPPDFDSQPASDSATEDNPSDRTSVFEPSRRRNGKRPEPPSMNLASLIPCAKVSSIELDYALVPFPPTGGHDFQSDLKYLVEETTAEFPGQRNANGTLSGAVEHSISVTTPSQGLMRGTISTRPVMMRLPHSKTFSMLYPLELPSPVKEGDCGSVVFDQHSRVYGFIAARSTTGNVAYIVPAAEILNDIQAKTSRMPESVSVGPKPRIAQLPPVPDTLVHVYQDDTSWKPKMSSWELVIADLPLDAGESYIRGMVPDSEDLEGIVMRRSASKPTGSCREATLIFSSEAATLSVYNRMKRQDPTNMALQHERAVQSIQHSPADKHTCAPSSPTSLYEQEPAQDSLDLGRLKDTIIRLVAKNEALQAENDQINKDLSFQKSQAAADKKALNTQAEAIKISKQKLAALEETVRESANQARVASEKIAGLEKKLAERQEGSQTTRLISAKNRVSLSLPPATNDVFPAKRSSTPLNKRDGSDPGSALGLHRAGRPNDQQSSSSRALPKVLDDLGLEQELNRARFAAEKQEFIARVAAEKRLAHESKMAEEKREDLKRRSKRSATAASSSGSRGIEPAYSVNMGPGTRSHATPKTYQSGSITIEGSGISLVHQAEQKRGISTAHSSAGDSTGPVFVADGRGTETKPPATPVVTKPTSPAAHNNLAHVEIAQHPKHTTPSTRSNPMPDQRDHEDTDLISYIDPTQHYLHRQMLSRR